MHGLRTDIGLRTDRIWPYQQPTHSVQQLQQKLVKKTEIVLVSLIRFVIKCGIEYILNFNVSVLWQVDGKLLCWLCTLSFKRALAKTKQSDAERRAHSKMMAKKEAKNKEVK